MPRASISTLPPKTDLTRSVGRVALLRFQWFTYLHLGFLTVSFLTFVVVIVEMFAGQGSSTALLVQSHLWPLLGFSGSSGGIGVYLKRLDQTEQHNMMDQQFLDALERLPASRQK